MDPKVLKAITEQIESRKDWEVQNLQQLSDLLGFTRWGLVTRFHSTELPQDAEYALSKGKAVLLLDRMPFALITPKMKGELHE